MTTWDARYVIGDGACLRPKPSSRRARVCCISFVVHHPEARHRNGKTLPAVKGRGTEDALSIVPLPKSQNRCREREAPTAQRWRRSPKKHGTPLGRIFATPSLGNASHLALGSPLTNRGPLSMASSVCSRSLPG